MNTLSALRASAARLALAGLAGCMAGPDYHRPPVELPTHFKEGADWQRADANPQGALSSRWWEAFGDAQLNDLVDRSLKANQSIIAAEAAYRLAQAEVAASTASLFPVVTANAAASRSLINSASVSRTSSTSGASAPSALRNSVTATATVSWEPDLWGQIRREIESSKENAQATDAQLAGERLSIAASVAADYLLLRQLDLDIASLEAQQRIDQRLLDMTHAAYAQGTASNDSLLVAEDTLEAVIAALQTSKISREQDEHALAVLVGVPPANFSVAPAPHYAFAQPPVPLALPSTLLERRPDIVAAEREAAAANAKIGVAKAAFFPALTLSAEGGFASSRLAHLFSLPNRIWTLGPALAETIFDAGARTAAVQEAEATYDGAVATYRGTVLSAFQSVEDSLSSVNHLNEEARAFESVYRRNVQLYASVGAQLKAGTASEQSLLTQQLTLLTAEQGARDAKAQAAQSTVTLIKNLGGGWEEADRERDVRDNGTGGPY
ncbi:efflux transporter outer membrane subunit [Trinickia mobilis]|uniref:efflux transporter outer membrane subunit n=1 Tax=Trinickia mobilis TaxID=2816356 RepID=UPI001A8E1E3C|nr:efflux transporter outer membrane subunit [Trinickia mobilis]